MTTARIFGANLCSYYKLTTVEKITKSIWPVKRCRHHSILMWLSLMYYEFWP